jgi:2-methylaconitate cis-trans-isomerase PrpF
VPQLKVPAAYYRGGTSRAIIFKEEDLAPYSEAERDAIVLAALGSPDPYGRELDGLGGGISSLSKAAIVGRASADSGADVTFKFAQVDVGRPLVEFVGNCGNISSAIGQFAVDEGYVPAREPIAPVRVLSVNTGQRFIAHVPTSGGRAEPEGDYELDGVSGRGAKIALEFLEPGGSQGRGLLPTGHFSEAARLSDGRELEVSIVDAANPLVFVRAADLGVRGTELPTEVDADATLRDSLQEVRDLAAVRIGLAADLQAAQSVQTVPKVAMVAPPTAYSSTRGRGIGQDEHDLVVRMLSMGTCHRAIALTGAFCSAVAAGIDDTIVGQTVRPAARERGLVRIGHGAGVLEIGMRVERGPDGPRAVSVSAFRTARRVMEGYVHVPESYLKGQAWFQRETVAAAAGVGSQGSVVGD